MTKLIGRYKTSTNLAYEKQLTWMYVTKKVKYMKGNQMEKQKT